MGVLCDLMGYLVAFGLFVAFCAALLNPYGRKLLAMMFVVAAVLITAGVLIGRNADASYAESVRTEQAASH